jgi:hypothetical protein
MLNRKHEQGRVEGVPAGLHDSASNKQDVRDI